ncbi:MAG: peptidase M20 [Thalassobius sp.]|nr:peptidase M20 [Thalassovita sp.]
MKKLQLVTAILSLGVLSLSFIKLPLKEKLDAIIEKDYDYLNEFYKHIHQNPEISLFEKETSKKLAEELRQIGFEVTENFGGYGIVGVLENGKGPTILYRTDMDALPVKEKTELAYASSMQMDNGDNTGTMVSTMHACGHDMHMTTWLGTARALKELSNEWKGKVIFIGQPAEEIGKGAKLMLDAGLYEKFGVPDYGIGLHCSPNLLSGTVGFGKGYTMANVESVDITVKGVGAHGAAPHKSIDPVVLASLIVMDLQTVVSRTIDPTDPAVLTVGAIQGGTKHNIIPDEVKLQITLRSYTDKAKDQLVAGIKRICKGQAIAAGLSEDMFPEVKVSESYTPSNYNDPVLVDRMIASSSDAIGEDNVVDSAPLMLGEDFSRYGRTKEDVPTVLMWLGTVTPERIASFEDKGADLPGLHSPYYYPQPDKTIRTGVKVMTTAIIDMMQGNKQ